MGTRNAGGFSLVEDPRTGNWLCRFRVEGRRQTLSTRTANREEAAKLGAQLYAEAVSGRRQIGQKRGPIAPIVAEWLAEIEGTVSQGYWANAELTWRVHLLPHFSKIEQLTPASCGDYYRARLRSVAVTTPAACEVR